MADDFDDDFLMDIPVPDESAVNRDIVTDECTVAKKMAFIGLGQAGSRIAEAFYKLGYKRVCVVNTAPQDLASIDLPEENKLLMVIDEGGAGKHPDVGAKAAARYREDIYDLMRKSFGKEFDRILVCAGTGGGTGGGSWEVVLGIAHEFARTLRIEDETGDTTVGLIATIPMLSEGPAVNANAAEALDKMLPLAGVGRSQSRTVSPLVLVDNERIEVLYRNVPAAKFWGVANKSIASLFHLFNSVAAKDSEYSTFDAADLDDVLGSGVITFGATGISSYKNHGDVAKAIRDNLKGNVLVSNLDVGVAEKAACVFIASQDVLEDIPQAYLEHGYEMLGRLMGGGAAIHRGIYKGGGQGSLRVYTMLGELGVPSERLEQIAKKGDWWPKILGKKRK